MVLILERMQLEVMERDGLVWLKFTLRKSLQLHAFEPPAQMSGYHEGTGW
jgi:hypothetical protein